MKEPYLEPLLTNVLSCIVTDNAVEITYPDCELLRKVLESEKERLKKGLKDLYGLLFRYKFSSFAHPFLPIPASSSKFNNYLLFVFNDSYFFIRKPMLIKAFSEGNKPKWAMAERSKDLEGVTKLFEFLQSFFSEVLSRLKEEWSYLHPIFLFEDYERMFFTKVLLENVFQTLERERGIKDVRRFIGNACFTTISYKNIFWEAL